MQSQATPATLLTAYPFSLPSLSQGSDKDQQTILCPPVLARVHDRIMYTPVNCEICQHASKPHHGLGQPVRPMPPPKEPWTQLRAAHNPSQLGRLRNTLPFDLI